MDPVTHALFGATVSLAVGGRRFGRHAAALGALAGITPDVDHFISSEQDPLLYVEYHRYFTHSIAFSFVGALVPLLPWLARPSFRTSFRHLWLCSWLAYLSHCLLDASTSWGTQLYWPFTRARAGWDLISIVDPVFTLALVAALAVALFRKSRPACVAGLVFALAYLALGGIQHARAKSVQEGLAKSRNHIVERSEVMPTLANNVVWRSVYLSGGMIYADRIRVGWFSNGQAREGSALPHLTEDRLLISERKANERNRGYNRFNWFADGWLARSPQDQTVLGDMRYSRSSEAFDPVWGIQLVDSSGPTLKWVSRERDRNLSLKELWAEISGKDPRFKLP